MSGLDIWACWKSTRKNNITQKSKRKPSYKPIMVLFVLYLRAIPIRTQHIATPMHVSWKHRVLLCLWMGRERHPPMVRGHHRHHHHRRRERLAQCHPPLPFPPVPPTLPCSRPVPHTKRLPEPKRETTGRRREGVALHRMLSSLFPPQRRRRPSSPHLCIGHWRRPLRGCGSCELRDEKHSTPKTHESWQPKKRRTTRMSRNGRERMGMPWRHASTIPSNHPRVTSVSRR